MRSMDGANYASQIHNDNGHLPAANDHVTFGNRPSGARRHATRHRSSPPPPQYDNGDHNDGGGSGGGNGFARHQRQRPRQGDESTDEIIRFVRGYQLEREPTLMRLQRKAVLPGIGQMNSHALSQQEPFASHPHPATHHSLSMSQQEPSFTSSTLHPRLQAQRRSDEDDDEFVQDEEEDRVLDDDDDDDDIDDDDDEDDLLDNEVAAIEARHHNPLRQMQGAYPDDLDWLHAGGGGMSGAGGGGVGGMTKRMDSYPPMAPTPAVSFRPGFHGPRHTGMRPLDGGRRAGGGGRRAAAQGGGGRKGLGGRVLLKQLPPIARDELPQRPSAPSPSLTPPLDTEEGDLDSAGEPVDFIDAA